LVPGWVRTAVVLRLLAALGGCSAIVATLVDTASRSPINPFNFFGYFTIQSNIFLCATLAVTASVTLRQRRQSTTLLIARGSTTAYIVIVGAVYNTLLAGLEGGVALPWANTVMHVVLPLYGAVDWVLFADRPPLPWRRIGLVLIYPIVWLVVVLLRGATDGWVPYPFLDPSSGYGSVAVYAVAIATVTILVAAAVWAASRLTLLKDQGSDPAPAGAFR